MAGDRISELWGRAIPIDLDRPRKLALTGRAWEALEEFYEDVDAIQKAWLEAIQGKRQMTNIIRFLWAMLQQEVHELNKTRRPSEQETLTLDNVRDMVDGYKRAMYVTKLNEAFIAARAITDPQTPAAETEGSRGAGGGHTNSAPQTTDGTGSDS